MKELVVLRHAKSSWKDASLDDFDRPLKKRGKIAAPKMGAFLRDQGIAPQLILCSSAVRTRQTLELARSSWNHDPEVRYLDDLYHASADGIADILRHEGPAGSPQSIMVVGHNMGLEDFVAELRGEDEAFPTAAAVQIMLSIKDWAQFDRAKVASSSEIWRPKELFKT